MMKKDYKVFPKEKQADPAPMGNKIIENTHLGSSNAFEETENPLSRDADNISDEKLDDLIGNG
jgi:hypothetical protein